MITPIYAYKLKDVDVNLNMATTPIAATGTENITFRYWIRWTRSNSAMALM
jgi:hypothetical protein